MFDALIKGMAFFMIMATLASWSEMYGPQAKRNEAKEKARIEKVEKAPSSSGEATRK